MGFGATPVAYMTGCRIIDSPRERLIAILTNSLKPCNGRFSAAHFSVLGSLRAGSAAGGALLLTGVIAASVGLTLLVSRISLGNGFARRGGVVCVELPPYRTPQIGRVIAQRARPTLFCRAAAVAAPAGVLIWLLANVAQIGECSYPGRTSRHF